MRRSDLIYEAAELRDMEESSFARSGEIHGTRFHEVTAAEHREGISAGRYVTLFTQQGDVRKCLTDLLRTFIPEGSVLVAGLGNENICSDSLGPKSLRYIPATAHLSGHRDFKELGMRKVFVLETGVTGKTGMESRDRISCIAGYIHACSVIAIDSLACAETDRLCTTIQITDTGISPGSGVGNDREALNRDTVGVPVIAIGVPTVIDLDSMTGAETQSGLMVTPRNIDIETGRLAEVIGTAVSCALNPGLSEEELRSLILL